LITSCGDQSIETPSESNKKGQVQKSVIQKRSVKQSPSKNGLLAHYCFDDSTDLGKDCSGNGRNLSITGSPEYLNGAVVFNDDSQKMRTEQIKTPQRSPYTVSGWVNFDQLSKEKGTWQHLFKPLYMHSADNRIYVYGTNNGFFRYTFSAGTWYHIAITYGAFPDQPGSYDAKYYLNGVEYEYNPNDKDEFLAPFFH